MINYKNVNKIKHTFVVCWRLSLSSWSSSVKNSRFGYGIGHPAKTLNNTKIIKYICSIVNLLQ